MGLAERKFKQKIGHDPRNLTWSDDKSRFSYKHMSNLGWNENSGIGGSDLSGNPNHIVVARKLDNSGIGMGRAKKEGDDAASGAGQAGQGLDAVLRRLAEASRSATPTTPTEEAVVEVKTEVVPSRNRIASRQKHLHSKRLASSSPAALAEILGVPVSSLPATASPSPTPAESTPEPQSGSTTPQASERTAEETISTSTLSVADYFRQKLREKMLARQSASGSSTPAGDLPEGSLSRVKEEVKVAVGGVEWEGSRTTFAEVKEEPDVKPTLPLQAKVEGRDDTQAKRLAKEERKREKEAKRERKAAKRALKQASEITVKTEPGLPTPASPEVKPDKTKRKRDKSDADRPAKVKKEKS